MTDIVEDIAKTWKPGTRMVGQKPTKRYWDQESATVAHEMKARGCTTTEIGAALNRDPISVRNFFNRHNDTPSARIALADRESGLTHKRCRKCEADRPLGDFAITRSKRGGERRWPYCKPCEIARLADRRAKGLHLDKARRHVAKSRERYPEKAAAQVTLATAVRYGRLVRPDSCEQCGQKPPRNRLGRSSIQGHHDDYSKPLEVRWLCQPCHNRHHRDAAALSSAQCGDAQS
jgi:hypothetical protein